MAISHNSALYAVIDVGSNEENIKDMLQTHYDCEISHF